MNDFYKNIIEETPFGYSYNKIILNDKGHAVDYRILEVNTYFSKLINLKKADITNKCLSQLNFITNDKFDWITEFGGIAINGGKKTFVQYSETQNKYFEVTVYSPKKHHFVTLFKDITTQKKEIETLKISKTKYKLLSETTDDILILHDTDGIIKYINPAGLNTLGYSKSEIIGVSVSNFIQEQDIASMTMRQKKRLLGEKNILKYNISLKHKNKSIIPFEFKSFMISEKNNEQQVLLVGRDITERKQTELLLKKNEEKYRNLIEANNIGYLIIDTKGNVIDANKEYVRLSGHKKLDEIIGRNVLEWTAESDIEKNKKALLNCSTTGSLKNLEINYVNKQGKITSVSFNSTIIDADNKKQMLTLCFDISNHKKAKEALLKSEEKYRFLSENSKDIICLHNPDGTYLYVSPSVKNILGYEVEELIGKKAWELVHPADLKYLANRHKNNITESDNNNYFSSYRIRKKSGEYIWLESSNQIIKDNNGNIINAVSSSRDISERKKDEYIIQQKNIQLQERNADLNTFAHTVAHDIKNPLSTIIGYADLINEDRDSFSLEEIKQFNKIILRRSTKIHQIIDSLLLLASTRGDNMKLSKINMLYIIEQSLKRVNFNSNDNNKIIYPQKWPIVMGDTAWVEEVWTNYISNAIKYGGNPLKIELGYDTETKASSPNNIIRFWIRDNGLGIDKNKQKLLFNKFERLDQVNIDGYGLGLSIVKQIINKLGGDVGVESELGKGSLFYFTLKKIEQVD